jgi:hypothetical protein
LLAQRVPSHAELRYFDDETYRHMTSVPKHVRAAVRDEKRIITEQTPLSIPL